MQKGDENNIEKVRKKYVERVFELYEIKSKDFGKVFSGLIVFALIFFFIVPFPYISIQHENYRINKQLENLTSEIDSVKERMDAYQKAQNGTQKLRNMISNGPLDLRNFIIKNHEAAKAGRRQEQTEQNIQNIQQTSQSDSCSSFTNESEWLDCEVQAEILKQFTMYNQTFNQDVVMPLQTLSNQSAVPINLTTLEKGLDNLQTAFKTRLANNPHFWKTYEGKMGFYVELDEEVEHFWKDYGSKIEDQSQKLKLELDKQQVTKGTYQNKLYNLV